MYSSMQVEVSFWSKTTVFGNILLNIITIDLTREDRKSSTESDSDLRFSLLINSESVVKFNKDSFWNFISSKEVVGVLTGSSSNVININGEFNFITSGTYINNVTPFLWETFPKNFTISKNLSINNLSDLMKDLIKDGWGSDASKFCYKSLDIKNSVSECKPVLYGTFCRSCGDYNTYAPADNVVADGKHTCWNCASSYLRIYRGLPNGYNSDKEMSMIRTINKIK